MRFPWITSWTEVQRAFDQMGEEFEQAARRGLATSWVPLELGATWGNVDPRYPAQARRDASGTTMLAGGVFCSVSPLQPGGTVWIGRVPAKMTPPRDTKLLAGVQTSYGAWGVMFVEVQVDGRLRVWGKLAGDYEASRTYWLSLDGLSFQTELVS